MSKPNLCFLGIYFIFRQYFFNVTQQKNTLNYQKKNQKNEIMIYVKPCDVMIFCLSYGIVLHEVR